MISSSRLLLAGLCLGAFGFSSSHAQTPPASTESLDRVEPYTLELDDEGRPRPGYFYLGFVHGRPHQMVHLGFNGRQSTSRGSAPFHGNPLSATVVRDPYGLRYYSLGWGANSLQQAVSWARAKAEKNGSLTPTEAALVALPSSLDAEGKARARRAGLNLFDPTTVGLLHDYARAHVDAWARDSEDLATGRLIDRWGLDNEWEGEGGPDYSPEARTAFSRWLDKAYGGRIAALNEAWGSAHGDFAAAAFGSLPDHTDYATRPAVFLDWWNFQTEHFVRTLAGLARTMHETDPLRRGVVHKSTQQTIEMPGVNRRHLFDHDLFAELMRPISGGLYGADMYGTGDRQAYELNYLYNCIRPLDGAPGYGVFLPETNNHGGPGHAFAATAWRMLANGLKAADLFTLGFAGAKNDWDKFGFIDPATGAPREKLYYAARWAHAIRRSEAFWTAATPASDLPRVAMLMPRRDVLLSDVSTRTTSRWGYPRNHRWMVYRWLREQGYWVDVIPYSKLVPENLRRYEGLFLIGAAHLTEDELRAVSGYVADGGILVADTNVGAFDEHHRPRSVAPTPLGVLSVGDDEIALRIEGHSVVGQGASRVSVPKSGRVIARATDDSPAAILADWGKGRVLHFPFELGTLILREPGAAMPAFLAEGPTADSEEYVVPAGEFVIGRWLGALLRKTGLNAAVSADSALARTGNLRVEQPYADAAGNLALIVTTRADSARRPVPAGKIVVPLPGRWTRALWAPAEHEGLEELPIRPLDGRRHEITLPVVSTAGVIYLFKSHEPLLGIPAISAPARSRDGLTAKVSPGKAFPVNVQLFNTTGAALPAGTLRILTPEGWSSSVASVPTPALADGASHVASFEVTPESDSSILRPDWLYPVVVRWADGERDRAVMTVNVETSPDPARIPLLLSGNASYPETYPYRHDTGATYRFVSPAAGRYSDPARGQTPALTNGFENRTGLRISGEGALANFATVNDTRATVVFDLKESREIMTVVVNGASRGPTPSRIRISAGDHTTGRMVLHEQTVFAPRSTEWRTPPLSAHGREVTIEIEWPATGGVIDEIEIWGR